MWYNFFVFSKYLNFLKLKIEILKRRQNSKVIFEALRPAGELVSGDLRFKTRLQQRLVKQQQRRDQDKRSETQELPG